MQINQVLQVNFFLFLSILMCIAKVSLENQTHLFSTSLSRTKFY